MNAVHELKTDPDCFQASVEGRKPYEVGVDDRGYLVGDHLHLRETLHTGEEMRKGRPLVYTGREREMTVRNILRGPAHGLQEGWVILS